MDEKQAVQTDFTHFNGEGRARMVNVGEKDETQRTATAAATVQVSPETFALIRTGGMKKGDVLTVAQIAGIMGAKRTPDLIPMCHPVAVNGIDLQLSLDGDRCSVEIRVLLRQDRGGDGGPHRRHGGRPHRLRHVQSGAAGHRNHGHPPALQKRRGPRRLHLERGKLTCTLQR